MELPRSLVMVMVPEDSPTVIPVPPEKVALFVELMLVEVLPSRAPMASSALP